MTASDAPLRSTLTLAAPQPMTEKDEAAFSEMVARIYDYCRGAPAQPAFGRPYMTWRMDLRARKFRVNGEKLLRWVYTPRKDARGEMVSASFEFHFAERVDAYFVGTPVSFKGPQLGLTGNEFERVFPADTGAPVPAEEWDRWGRGATAEIARHYETILHPRVAETIAAIAELRGRALTVVDLGGGSGALAERIVARVPLVTRVTVLERSAALVAEARARAEAHAGKIVVARGDLLDARAWDALEGAPDVLVLCGVVAHQVIAREDALRVVDRCRARLETGGFLLVPSYSPALLTGEDYASLGFAVHNATASFVEQTAKGPALRTNDFYVLEKR